MIKQLLDSSYTVPDSPGSYFSGAPGLYPVLAALADSVGGLYGARLLSLLFTSVAIFALYGMTRRLFGTSAAIVAAASFAVAGPVLYQSHFATYDAMMMSLVAIAAWLTVRSVQSDRFLYAPVVGVILLLAALTKYAGLVYAPLVLALAVAEGWSRLGWTVVRRAVFAAMTMATFAFLVIALWGQSMIPGFVSTTLERNVLNPSSPSDLTHSVVQWIGPWLGAAALGAVLAIATRRSKWMVVLVLLAASVAAPLQQIRIGEATSLSKHLAFGLLFAAPLIGVLGSLLIRKVKYLGALVVIAGVGALGVLGAQSGSTFLSSWVPNDQLTATVRQYIPANNTKAVLGEQPAGERYSLRDVLPAQKLADTYSFGYSDKSGIPAYSQAIKDRYFGVVWLSQATDTGVKLNSVMTQAVADGLYIQRAEVPRYLDGKLVGYWTVYTATEENK